MNDTKSPNLDALLRWTRASAALKLNDEQTDTLRLLLEAAADLGLTLSNVAEALHTLQPSALPEAVRRELGQTLNRPAGAPR
jgi:hypothetical protein